MNKVERLFSATLMSSILTAGGCGKQDASSRDIDFHLPPSVSTSIIEAKTTLDKYCRDNRLSPFEAGKVEELLKKLEKQVKDWMYMKQECRGNTVTEKIFSCHNALGVGEMQIKSFNDSGVCYTDLNFINKAGVTFLASKFIEK